MLFRSGPRISRHAIFTKNHPLGQILIDFFTELSELAKKTKVKEMSGEVEDICSKFHNAVRHDKQSTFRLIKQALEEFEQQMIDSELNGHLLNDNSYPPEHFSQVPTLISSQKRNEALKAFPVKPKFSGSLSRDSGVDIVEYLSSMKTAQNYCNLSEHEFKEFLLLTTTGRAHALISDWIDLNETIPNIYHNLLMTFEIGRAHV